VRQVLGLNKAKLGFASGRKIHVPCSIMADKPTTITRWLLDTRALWPGPIIHGVRDKSSQPAICDDEINGMQAAEYLEAVPPKEQQDILKKYHLSDARMSLGSALLKRAYVAQTTGLEWHSIALDRRLHPTMGKPCWLPPPGEETSRRRWPQVDFNVSHQNGIVVLVGICAPARQEDADDGELQVSVDIVSPNERNQLAKIGGSDFASFISVYENMFSEAEIFSLTYTLPPTGHVTLRTGVTIPNHSLGRLDRTIISGELNQVELPGGRKVDILSDVVLEEKLRNFYAAFSLKEAYVKLGGEGIGAEWIQQLELQSVRAPTNRGVPPWNLSGVWGESVTSHSGELGLTLHGEDVTDVFVEIQALEEDYLISTMLKPAKALGDLDAFPGWKMIDVERDILPIFRETGGGIALLNKTPSESI
jgi:4'-phosphopantetheinyl transferase